MSSEKIVIFGSIVQDLISYTEDFPRPGESVRGSHFLAGGGGKGANQSVAAAKLHENVVMIAKVGKDIFGDSNIKGLRDAGVNVSHIQQIEEANTATATITVNNQGENSIVVVLGANLYMDADYANKVADELNGASIVLCQAEISQAANRRIFEIARSKGVRTFFNPAPGDRNLDKSILELVDIVCTNENEAEFLTGISADTIDNAKKAARKMQQMGPRHVIITLGPQGVVVLSEEKEDVVAVAPTNAVDTTGAGDCFCGSFAAFLAKGSTVWEAAGKAALIASLSVQRKGTQSSYWRKEEIAEVYPNIF
ncbi:unnamed protein product [Auanema sp. JU1783]|nr:unnamed protein product [Auanema sp. JU1783]